MIRAFQDAKNARSLYAQKPQPEEMYALTVGELRARIGVPAAGLATLRGKHSTAPKTSASASLDAK